VYDAPNPKIFNPIIEPIPNKKSCIFAYFNSWQKGKTLSLKKDNATCKGCGNWWFDKQTRTLDDFVKFLADEEGLKNSNKKMEQWILNHKPYTPKNNHLLMGPYDEKFKYFAKTITFWVNADQLSVLSLASYYFNEGSSPAPLTVPFGSGCMQALTLFEDFSKPAAILGSMDLAMRKYLPSNIFGFTVTIPMFDLFMKIDEQSFLSKPFLNMLIKARGGSL
jgi:hypothetical protein